MAYRIGAGIIGAFYLIQGINWIARPAAAAEALGMPLLDGIGRSTQIGDMSSFFLTIGSLGLIGGLRSNPLWLHAAAGLLGTAAVVRTLAWLLHDAPLASVFIGVEIVSATAFVLVGSRFGRASRGRTG